MDAEPNNCYYNDGMVYRTRFDQCKPFLEVSLAILLVFVLIWALSIAYSSERKHPAPSTATTTTTTTTTEQKSTHSPTSSSQYKTTEGNYDNNSIPGGKSVILAAVLVEIFADSVLIMAFSFICVFIYEHIRKVADQRDPHLLRAQKAMAAAKERINPRDRSYSDPHPLRPHAFAPTNHHTRSRSCEPLRKAKSALIPCT